MQPLEHKQQTIEEVITKERLVELKRNHQGGVDDSGKQKQSQWALIQSAVASTLSFSASMHLFIYFMLLTGNFPLENRLVRTLDCKPSFTLIILYIKLNMLIICCLLANTCAEISAIRKARVIYQIRFHIPSQDLTCLEEQPASWRGRPAQRWRTARHRSSSTLRSATFYPTAAKQNPSLVPTAYRNTLWLPACLFLN